MKVAVLTDVHANLPALEAAFEQLERVGYDVAVHLGDAVGIGPFPVECVDLLHSMPNMRFVRGNHDEDHDQQLLPAHQQWLSTLPESIEFDDWLVPHFVPASTTRRIHQVFRRRLELF